MERGRKSDAPHVRVGQLVAVAHFLKMSVQRMRKLDDRMVILGSYYPSEFAGLGGRFVARIGTDGEFRMIGLNG
jgi:hypothetical protein